MLKQGLQGRTKRYEIQETTPPNGTIRVKAEGMCENMMEDEMRCGTYTQWNITQPCNYKTR